MLVVQTWEGHRQIANFLAELREPAPEPAPAPPSPDLQLWNSILKKYVSTNPSLGDAALRRRMAEIQFDGVTLQAAVAMLADQAHADLVADWSMIESARVPTRSPISLRLRDVTFAEALRAVLESAGAGRLDFHVNGACVILGLPAEYTYELTTRVYDIRDWPDGVIGSATSAKGSFDPIIRHEQLVRRLLIAIRQVTSPGCRITTDLDSGVASEINGRLVVTDTWENQERVADLLAALREDPSRLRMPPSTAPATSPAHP
jgi:hypothetical protein